jgi:hypothetical protein
MTILYLENFTGKIEATGTITIKTEPISKSLEHSNTKKRILGKIND